MDDALVKEDGGWFPQPFWLAGFRPFFFLAFVSGVLLPGLWALAFSGLLPLGSAGLVPMQWHAHEMLFGFGWAVLGGFLLTASKNWVHVRGIHGGPLVLAALLWVVERGAIFFPPTGVIGALRWVLLNACVLFVGGYVAVTLVRHRKQDSFKDNGYFLIGLPLFLVAKNLLLHPTTWNVGVTLSVGIFRLAFVVMFERTIVQFMKGTLGISLPRRLWLDRGIKVTVLLAAFEALLPAKLAAAVLALAGLLLFVRLLTWSPLRALTRFGVGIMYVGYLGLVLHFAFDALAYSGLFVGIGSLPIHVFTLLTMGIIIPAMLIRICQGHTGRKPAFLDVDKVAFGFMGAAAFFRVVATQLWPLHYRAWIGCAALGWSICFLMIGWRLVPFLFRPRVDGRIH